MHPDNVFLSNAVYHVVWCGVVWCGVLKVLVPKGNGGDVLHMGKCKTGGP